MVCVRCTTRRGSAHRTEERKVLYPWHPWAGHIVHIHEVIEKAAGNVVRCSHAGGAADRLLELPLWMFDRAYCAPMRSEACPQVDVTALQALRALLDETVICGSAVGLASTNVPVSGAAKISHDQNRGEVHETPTAGSTRPSKQDAAVRSVRYGKRRQRGTNAGVAGAPRANAPGADDTDDAPHLRPRPATTVNPTAKKGDAVAKIWQASSGEESDLCVRLSSLGSTPRSSAGQR